MRLSSEKLTKYYSLRLPSLRAALRSFLSAMLFSVRSAKVRLSH